MQYYHIWQSAGTVAAMYASWQAKTDWYRDMLGPILAPYPGPLLDAGCGQGILLDWLPELAPRYTGLDIVPEMIRFFRQRHPDVSTILGDIRKMPVPDKSFAITTCLNVLRHLPDDDYCLALQELGRVTNRCVLIATPLSPTTHDLGVIDRAYSCQTFLDNCLKFLCPSTLLTKTLPAGETLIRMEVGQ